MELTLELLLISGKSTYGYRIGGAGFIFVLGWEIFLSFWMVENQRVGRIASPMQVHFEVGNLGLFFAL